MLIQLKFLWGIRFACNWRFAGIIASIHQPLTLIIGAIFVMEVRSDSSSCFFKTRGKNFRMSPIHHLLKGWKETKGSSVFGFSASFALLGLATLKLR